MNLRDWFAWQALAVVVQRYGGETDATNRGGAASEITKLAYRITDASLPSGEVTMPTFCEDCDNVIDKKRSVSSWVCVKFPRLEGMGFVGPKIWAEQEPYMRCVNINGGACPMYSPIRNSEEG